MPAARTVLLVDDSSSIRSILKVYLMGLSAEVVDADGGERAFQIARLVPLSLVIADLNMPGMDGLALLRKLRTDGRANAKVPVILLTGDKSEEARLKMAEAGANAVLYKPIASDVLLTTIKGLLPEAK
jgi:two-component system, chemotaxis family, chemotaxis protein CheY